MTHTTHIAARFVTTEAATLRQVFKACCSCGWHGTERVDITPRAARLARAETDAVEHVEIAPGMILAEHRAADGLCVHCGRQEYHCVSCLLSQ